jgi:hypothetical protein
MHTLDEALALQSPADHVANRVPKEYAALLAISERITSRMVGPTFDHGLTRGERLAHILFFVMDAEIQNGGLHQFFANSSGDLAEDAKQGLREIGATNVLAVLMRASAIFPNGMVPTSRDTRTGILDKHEDERGDDFWDEFDVLSREYYRARKELYPLLLSWIRINRDQFALPDDETVRKMNGKRTRKRKRAEPSVGEGFSSPELDTLVREAQAGLAQLEKLLRMINIRAVAAPTQAQVRALRNFEPFKTENLVAIRKALSEGSVRLGPLAEEVAAEAVETLLAPLGLQCRLVPIAPDDLE